MLIIYSIIDDPSTNDVIDWLSYTYPNFILYRFNPENVVDEVEIEIENGQGCVRHSIELPSGKIKLDLGKVKVFWYRRGYLQIRSEFQIKNKIHYNVLNYLDKEWSIIFDYMSKILTGKHKLGDIKNNHINKLEVLLKATSLQIEIPKTIVSTKTIHKMSLVNMITKCLYNGGFNIDIDYNVGSFTQRAVPTDKNTFFPSLFQEEIEKLYELRIFYLNGKFYPAAIFSQGNSKTEVDFRNYDSEKPNRVVPYHLPNEIESKLKTLMDALQLETGSIDMIVTPQNKYVFLEVNPIGQFSQVSIPCNYFLEEKIAKYLSNEQNR